MTPWLIPLFFICIALGYALGRIDYKRQPYKNHAKLANDYARSINFLLNEQPDEAVELLLECLDVNEGSLETYLSLARLFRRKGEFDRASHIHESLLASEALGASARADVLLELALDFMAGGLFDRAELLFMEMIDGNSRHRRQAMRYLMEIFEREKDWHNALVIGQQLWEKDASVGAVLAHYCSELALSLQANGAIKAARRTLRRALYYDKKSVRAWLMMAELAADVDAKAALYAYMRLYDLDDALFDEVLIGVEAVFQKQKGETEWLRFLADACISAPSTARVLRLASGLEAYYGEREAAHLLVEYMKENPSIQGVNRFIDLQIEGVEQPLKEALQVLRELTGRLSIQNSSYQCRDCGFSATQMHWQCPSCKHWGSVKPGTRQPQLPT